MVTTSLLKCQNWIHCLVPILNHIHILWGNTEICLGLLLILNAAPIWSMLCQWPIWIKNASTQFSATSVVVWHQTGKSSSTTMVFLPAVFLLQLHLDHCSARTDGRGQIDPTCPLRGRGGHWYQAPREPAGRMKVKTKTRDDEWQYTLYFCMICDFTRSYLKINALMFSSISKNQPF